MTNLAMKHLKAAWVVGKVRKGLHQVFQIYLIRCLVTLRVHEVAGALQIGDPTSAIICQFHWKRHLAVNRRRYKLPRPCRATLVWGLAQKKDQNQLFARPAVGKVE